MTKDIKAKIVDIINNVMQVNITYEENLNRTECAAWDSLKHMELILSLEEEFNIRLSLAQVGAIESTDDVATIIEHSLRKASE